MLPLVVLVVAAACASAAKQPPDWADDEYAVWGQAIRYSTAWRHGAPVNIAPTAEPARADTFIRGRLRHAPGIPEDLADDFLSGTAGSARISMHRLARASHLDVLPGLPENNGFPAPTLILTRVGFDAQRRNALVQVHYFCGSLCGSFETLHLQRDVRGRWRVVGTPTSAVI
jgi:hypothetical protein